MLKLKTRNGKEKTARRTLYEELGIGMSPEEEKALTLANRMAGKFYSDTWNHVMTGCKLGDHRVSMPDRKSPTSNRFPRLISAETDAKTTDRLIVKLAYGQHPEDFQAKAEHLANAWRAISVMVRPHLEYPGYVIVDIMRVDTLAEPFGAMPIPEYTDLKVIHVGDRADGQPWTIRLKGSMVLLGGSTGSGKSGILWGLCRGLLPGIMDGTVRVFGCDPKHLELARGRSLFENAGGYADQPGDIDKMLLGLCEEMGNRAAIFASRKMRDHEPSQEFPAIIVMVDELAYAISYVTDKKVKDSITNSLQSLCTQGRALGITVIGAAQDNRVETNKVRHLFNYRICLRMDSPDQVDMLLGTGSRDLGALADKISGIPESGAGMAYVREEGSTEVVRVRAGYVSDEDIDEMVEMVTNA